MINRRRFIADAALTTSALSLMPSVFGSPITPVAEENRVSFFIVGDTHYCADAMDISKMNGNSASYNASLVDQLNRLAGSTLPGEIGGGTVAEPHGVIHVGDIIDNGDKGPSRYKMAETETAAFISDWGLNGKEGKLRWPVCEVHGNHDSPHGDGPVISTIKERNKRRHGVLNVSESGVHYSWNWGNVHFVCLGIVVGDAPEVTRKRRYAPMGSLPFLRQDLREHVGTSGRPVVLVHHVDLHRYSVPVPDEKVLNHEWDYGDAIAYYETLKPYNVIGTLCGHTHSRKIARWNGTKDDRVTEGVPFLNTDNGAHFSKPDQAILHVDIDSREMKIREFSTNDGWKSGTWKNEMWTFPLKA
jgi:cytolysin (calcineurin-like family phosphatase)